MSVLKNFLTKSIRFISHIMPKEDKAEHFIFFIIITRVFQVWFENVTVIVIVSILVLGKEIVVDKLLKMGEYELGDILWGFGALATMVVLNQLELYWC